MLNIKKLEYVKDVLCSWTGMINMVKKVILSKAIYKFNIILIKIPISFFIGIGKNKTNKTKTKRPNRTLTTKDPRWPKQPCAK